MNDYTKLLAQKDISPLGKLIILDICEFPSIMTYKKTSQEIALSLGVKRKSVLNELDKLQEMNLITCKILPRVRVSKITNKLKEMIDGRA